MFIQLIVMIATSCIDSFFSEFSQDPYYGSLSPDGTDGSDAGLSALLHWSCSDECRYQCMWHTTKIFLSDDRGIPQFNGKVGSN